MMDRKIKPDLRTFTVMVDAICKEGNVEEALDMVQMMIREGIMPDVVTYSALIDGYCLQSGLKEAKKVFEPNAKSRM